MSYSDIKIGDTYTALAVNGHLIYYTVTGFYDNGAPIGRQYDARCNEECKACKEGLVLPDW